MISKVLFLLQDFTRDLGRSRESSNDLETDIITVSKVLFPEDEYLASSSTSGINWIGPGWSNL
jgi:hypothetical protein